MGILATNKFYIEFSTPKNKAQFQSDELIAGNVILDCKKPIKVESIWMEITGIAKLTLQPGMYCRQNLFVSTNSTQTYIFYKKIMLWQSEENNILPMGKHVLPFIGELTPGCPPSLKDRIDHLCSSSKAKIKYKCAVKFAESRQCWLHDFDIPFIVLSPCRISAAQIKEPIDKMFTTIKLNKKKNEQIQVKCFLLRIVYLIKEQIEFVIRMDESQVALIPINVRYRLTQLRTHANGNKCEMTILKGELKFDSSNADQHQFYVLLRTKPIPDKMPRRRKLKLLTSMEVGNVIEIAFLFTVKIANVRILNEKIFIK